LESDARPATMKVLRQLVIVVARRLPPGLVRWVGQAQFARRALRGAVGVSSGLLIRDDVTIPRGRASGLRFNAAGTHPGYVLGTSEPALQEAVWRGLAEGGVFYDVGAAVGFFTVIAARRVGVAGRVIAFEPLPANVEGLQHNVRLNRFDNVTIVEAAVAGERGSAAFVPGDGATGGRLALGSEPGSLTIEVVSLDDAIPERGLPLPDLVKLDIEGAEVEAVLGMEGTLASVAPTILCELHGTYERFAPLLRDLGYRVTPLEGPDPPDPANWTVHVIASPRKPKSL
jgi:FkbM family methyltransferase